MPSLLTTLSPHPSLNSTQASKTYQLPSTITPKQLAQLLPPEETYEFTVDGEKFESLGQVWDKVEEGVVVVYSVQAKFKVHPVTRLTGTLKGHTAPVLVVAYSPTGGILASGSADTTIRIWDTCTSTPKTTLTAHKSQILALAWDAEMKFLISADKDGGIGVWRDPHKKTTEFKGDNIITKGHKLAVTALDWQPVHRSGNHCLFITASKDCTTKIWDPILRKCLQTLGGHKDMVTAVKWGGSGLIYTASRDRTINVWNEDGTLCRSLQEHTHWINSLSLSTDFILKTGYFDHTGAKSTKGLSRDECKAFALQRWLEAKGAAGERLVSASDDMTMFLWNPESSKKSVARLNGHQNKVMQVAFAPNAQLIASCAFDSGIKIWDGCSGAFICNFRGHISSVYQIAWSSDSRMLASGSKDSTLKIWDLGTRKVKSELPGHEDEVFALDWSPDGDGIASGGRDRALRIWQR